MSPPSRLSGGGSDGHARRDGAARAIDDVDREPVLHLHVILGADAPEEREGVAIAAKQHVLAVVDALAGRGIGERGRAAAKRRPRLEDEDARALLGERGGGAQPREAAADHDRVGGQRLNIARAHSRSAITAR